MKHIIFYSGGIGSWATAKRVIEKEGKENVILLFTDTLIEDPDLYRFLKETAEDFGVHLEWIEDGRDIWDVFRDTNYLGNSRFAPCSHELKQKPADKWVKEHFEPDECILYLGIDWTEEHRTAAPAKNWAPYEVRFPMCEEPYLTKEDMLKDLESHGIERPELYKLDFSHNNCGGFCVRAGQGHFKHLYETKPELYKYHEQKEQEMREYLGKNVTILRRMVKGKRYNLTLRQLREEIETGQTAKIDVDDIGGCGCFVTEKD